MIYPEQLKLDLRVKANQEFSGVPAGTVGVVVEASNSCPECESVAIRWKRYPGDVLTDWFAFDELQFLDLEH